MYVPGSKPPSDPVQTQRRVMRLCLFSFPGRLLSCASANAKVVVEPEINSEKSRSWTVGIWHVESSRAYGMDCMLITNLRCGDDRGDLCPWQSARPDTANRTEREKPWCGASVVEKVRACHRYRIESVRSNEDTNIITPSFEAS